MPKGIKSKLPSALKRVAQVIVPPNARFYPQTECAEHPEGIALPDGLRVRTGRGVEVRFKYQGERVSETVRGKPTVEFVVEVGEKRDRILQAIGLGKFDEADYREAFPDSSRFQEAAEAKVYTVRMAMEDWLVSRKNTFGVNTDRDYVRAIRNQIIPMKLDVGAKVAAHEYVKPEKDCVPPREWLLPRHEGGPLRPIDPADHLILGNLPLARLDDVLFNHIRNQWLNEGIGVKRINNLIGPIRGAIERAFAMKLIECNPLVLVKPLRKTVKEEMKAVIIPADDCMDAPLPDEGVSAFYAVEGKPDPFSPAELEAIIAQLDEPMANQIAFAFWTGLRTGEVIALRVSDLQLDRGRIRVRRSVSRGVLKTAKTDRERWVHLVSPARAALEAQLKLLEAPGGWVFPNPFTMRRWANDSKITKRWERALKQANVRYRRPYQTRHTFASMMLSGGENTMHIAHQMGHADWSMLVKVYAKWIPSASKLPAGELVSKAQSHHWAELAKLLQVRETVTPQNNDYKDDGQKADGDKEELVA